MNNADGTSESLETMFCLDRLTPPVVILLNSFSMTVPQAEDMLKEHGSAEGVAMYILKQIEAHEELHNKLQKDKGDEDA